MKIPNTICQLEGQRNLLERHQKHHGAITPHILCISVLALLTGCNATLELKPDKAPGGTTGSNRPIPSYPSQIGPLYPGQVYPGPIYPGPVYQVLSIRVRLLRRMVVMGRGLSRLAIRIATVQQVVALQSSLHLAEGERQSYRPLSVGESSWHRLGGSEL